MQIRIEGDTPLTSDTLDFGHVEHKERSPEGAVLLSELRGERNVKSVVYQDLGTISQCFRDR